MVETITKEIQFRFEHLFSLTDGNTKQRYNFERHCQSMRCVTECYKRSRGPVFKLQHPVLVKQDRTSPKITASWRVRKKPDIQ